MDITSILSSIKGKVLDATHFELLKHSYDLQNQNIEQLKNNNEALKESNQLLEDKIATLEKENQSLRALSEELSRELEAGRRDTARFEPSEVAQAILRLYREQDVVKLYEAEIAGALQFNRIEIEAAFDELEEAKVLHIISIRERYGKRYALTDLGKKYLAQDHA